MNSDRLNAILSSFSEVHTILIVGDFFLDKYLIIEHSPGRNLAGNRPGGAPGGRGALLTGRGGHGHEQPTSDGGEGHRHGRGG